jgi:hypothetical protein
VKRWCRVLPAALALALAACGPRIAAARDDAPAAVPASVPLHVMTLGFVGAEHGVRDAATYRFGIAASYAQAASVLTWAITDDRFAPAVHAAGMHTAFYTDPHRLSPNGFPMAHAVPGDERAYYHNCDGSRVRTSYDGTLTQNVGDLASPALLTFWNAYIDAHQRATGAAYDAVWEDDAGPLGEFYQPFDTPLPGCWYPGDARYADEQRAFDAHAHLPVIFENLANHHGAHVSDAVALVAAPNVVAGLLEFCFANGYGGRDARAKEAGTIWRVEEETVVRVIAERRMLICYDYPSGAADAAAYDQRGYIAASFLLTFDPRWSVLAEQVETPSGVDAEPESAFVPLDPVRAAPQSIEDLRTATGAYAREYRACYLHGRLLGGCAIVVNPDAHLPVFFPFRDGYRRTLRIAGRGAIAGIDDGTIALGAAPATLVAPLGWVIALR